MQPTIQEGDIITVAPLKLSEVTRGDILLYRGDTGVIAHRVVAIKRSKEETPVFILRGDASDTCDFPLQAEQLLGKVVGVERQGHSLILGGRRVKMIRTLRLYAGWIKRRIVSVTGSLRGSVGKDSQEGETRENHRQDIQEQHGTSVR